jgi:Transposase DDE domain group 1
VTTVVARAGTRKRPRVRFGAPDPSVTGRSGIAAITALCERLGVIDSLDEHIGPIKQRDRGLTGGEVLVGLATAQLMGQGAFSGLDRLRADAAGSVLAPVPTPPARSGLRLAGQFGAAQRAGIETAFARLTDRWLVRLPAQRRAELVCRRPTIDLDSTEVEVYGRKKRGVARNYAGQLAGRPHLASWADAGLTLAGDLLSGTDDVRTHCADLLRRALTGLPAAVCARPKVRADAGYFCAGLAHAAVEGGADFAIAAKRNTAMWRAYGAVPAGGWTPARDMPGAQVTAVDNAPAGWPPGSYTLIRRVRVDAADVSHDPRSRRRRTIPKDQLALVLGGDLDHTWAVSFIVTNLPANDGADIIGIEAWFRGRADIETRIKEAKLGAGLRHLPSGEPDTNATWMFAALLAGQLSVMLQSLTGLDATKGRAHADRLRHELLCVPARLTRHARGITLRLPPGHDQLLPAVLARLHALPAYP